MKRRFSSAVCAAALLMAAGAATNVLFTPAIAQDVQVDFQTFHDSLAPYGDWVYSDRWGEVWIPTDVSDDFHPYGTRGHWDYTDQYGWVWASDYEWGDIPFHYGRWVNDPDDGWLWIPGYVWSPGWVVWRHNGQYTGWMPMPPDDQFLGRPPAQGVSVGISIGGVNVSFGDESDDYGYSRYYGPGYGEDRYAQNWLFVGTGHIADRDYRRYEAPRNNYGTIIRDTTNITNYTVVNNYIVNKSVDPDAVRHAGGHVQAVQIATVVKRPQFITRADVGVQTQQHAREERPHGTGFANSAPKPSDAIVQSLSAKAPPARAGHASAHLFTRDTVTKATLAPAKPGAGGKPEAPGATPMAPMPGMKGEGKPGTPAAAPTMGGPAATPAETKKEEREHGAGAPNGGPSMMGPAATPAETKKEERLHEHATTPETATPMMGGPAVTPAETKKEERLREHATTPQTTTPMMGGPAATPAETKKEERLHATTPETAAPTMSGPAATPAETKKEERLRERTTTPETATPMMGGPAAEKPKHEELRAPVVERPVTPPAAAHGAPPPKAEKEKKEKPKKPDQPQ
jgi:hypothetical protein